MLVLKASMAKMQVKVHVWWEIPARARGDALPFCQFSALLCTLQIALNDDELTGNLWVEKSSQSQQSHTAPVLLL